MNYEIKPFSVFSYDADVDAGWEPTLRNWQDCESRKVLVAILPECADPKYRVCSINPANGDVYQHDARGMFDTKRGETCLDLVMRKAVKAKREVQGVAYVDGDGKVVFASTNPCRVFGEGAVPCTITIEEG